MTCCARAPSSLPSCLLPWSSCHSSSRRPTTRPSLRRTSPPSSRLPSCRPRRATANDGSVSAVSDYGPPYDSDTSASQHIGPINPAAWAKDIFGVTTPINPPQDLIIKPLRSAAALDPALGSALDTYEAATPQQQAAWLAAYRKVLALATVSGGAVTVPPGNYGPVPQLMTGMLSLGRSGLLEGALAAEGNSYYPYNFDFTKALLFFAIASPLLRHRHTLQQLGDPQWGIVHETGNYPVAGGSTSTSSGAPGAADRQQYERRPDRRDYHDGAVRRTSPVAVQTGPAPHPPRRQGLPADLAQLVPRIWPGDFSAARDKSRRSLTRKCVKFSAVTVERTPVPRSLPPPLPASPGWRASRCPG